MSGLVAVVDVSALLGALRFDSGIVVHLGIGLALCVALLRFAARAAWAGARVLAVVLVGLVLVAMLAAKPWRLGEFGTLRRTAHDAARDLLG